MVSILKSKKEKTQSIHGEVLRFSNFLFISIAIIIITGIGMYSLSVWGTIQENKHLLLVNKFYTNLLENKNHLYHSITKQDIAAFDKLHSETDDLLALLNQMSQLNISQSFHHNVADISAVMENYQAQVLKIQNYMKSGEKMDIIHDAFHDALDMYNIINDSFHPIYVQIVDSGWQYTNRLSRIRKYYLIVLVPTVAMMICCLLLQLRSITYNISLPIQQLIKELEGINLQNVRQVRHITENPDSNNDIRLLIHVYNSMLDKIKKQLLEQESHMQTQLKLNEQELMNLKIRNELKKSQLMNLQNQINPHFLFNTLNMISQSAYLENDFHTVTLLETTSDLLRYALDYSDKPVSLANEIKHLGDYVYLQEQRFGSRIRFLFHLDESFHHVQIPNLILQPILENAIIHGLGMCTEGGQIIIETKYDPQKEQGRISIIDNGVGMDDETQKEINQKMRLHTTETGKIGLSNVFFRLSIFFEQQADILLSSIPNKGTEISIYIPCHCTNTEVSEHVPNHNS